MTLRIILFLVINFAALALGGLFTGKGVPSDWYQSLNKAPWTPPGWMFGAAWTAIMICFSVYMAQIWQQAGNRNTLLVLFVLQWVLNVSWNPVFFYFHHALLGLVVIAGLTLLIGFIFFNYLSAMKLSSAWLLPYMIWLIIATSLNAYIYIKN